MTTQWSYYTEREHDDDKWSYEHFATHRLTKETIQLDISSNRPDIPVEEWLLHVELGFPTRGELRGCGPIELADLINIRKRRAENHE